uniref:Dynein light intermediate chain n=1 Tax=Nomascus leucogenys TaxID=61853 RepID=A0A2I3H567_NOMLE
MAPVGVEKKMLEEEEGQSLWSSILSEVSTRARSKLPSGKNILVFGEDGSGKTTLMTKLQGAEHGKKGRGLEYLYLSVHDEDRDVVKDFQDYMEPEEGCQGSPQRRGPLTSGSDEENVALPLGDNVLTHNLGIPVLVVCTKCDAVSVLEKEHDYRDEHLDFIQSHLRRFCLQYGAALIYTSVKEEKNLDLLYKYIVHKTYGFHFTTPALVVEKDAVFIPAGWDNEKKIAILHENFTTVKPEDAYEDFIVKPPVRKLVHDKELAAEDEQVFLMKQQVRRPESPARGPSGSPRTQASVPSSSPGTSVKKPDPNIKSMYSSNAYNFKCSFKKIVSSSHIITLLFCFFAFFPGQKTVLSNVQEELDRMTRKPDSMVTNSSTENEA